MNANVDYIIKTAIGEFNYLDYEGQHITATNSIEGHARSAILKGQTKLMDELGNECDHPNRPNAVIGAYINASTGEETLSDTSCRTTYIKAPHETFKIRGKNRWKKLAFYDVNKQLIKTLDPAQNNYNDCVVNSTLIPSNAEYMRVSGSLSPINSSDVLESVLEILDVNNSSLYITHLESVKMPVLTTTGKNLFDMKAIVKSDFEKGKYQPAYYGKEVQLQPNTTYIIKPYLISEITNTKVWTVFNVINKGSRYEVVNVNRTGSNDNNFLRTQTFTTDETGMVGYSIYAEQNREESWFGNLPFEVQLEQGSQATSYEPYKTNILHTPEEVVLRSLPNGVCDTLNVETGEYVQRIGEVVLNGNNNESWDGFTGRGGLNYFRIPCPTMAENNREKETPKFLIADKINFDKYSYLYESTSIPEDVVGGTTKSSALGVQCIYVYYKNVDVVNTFKQYLQQNPITIQYELATPIIKTVDLSDNVVYSYGSTTHYSCSSAGGSLVPTLSVKVPTDTQLTIQEQKAAAQTLLVKNMDLQQSIKDVQAMNLAFNTALYNSFNSIREEVEDIKKHVSTNENLEGSF